jgi:hypothetical protein
VRSTRGTVEVATQLDSEQVRVRLEFDDGADIIQAHTDARPYLKGRRSCRRPRPASSADTANTAASGFDDCGGELGPARRILYLLAW